MCYNRYSEKDTGAPPGVHPDYLRKNGKAHANYYQRTPHFSRDIIDNLDEFYNICDMLTDIGIFIAENMLLILTFPVETPLAQNL
ncbi:hypothetical protein DXG01_014285 [Tephrocybe rancida]|nr:hypothetical protein DXG01_014285 [Tephrocybe rancida]